MPSKKSWKEDPLGPPDETKHRRFVSDVEEILLGFSQQSRSFWADVVAYWDLYLGKWADPRDPVTEKWRAHVTLPYPYSGVESKLASLSDIFLAADPMVQAEAASDEDFESARGVEKLFDYTFRATQFAKFLVGRQRDCLIQGTSFFKLVHKEITSTRYEIVTDQQRDDFLRSLEDLESRAPELMTACPDFTKDPEGFEKWREMVKLSKKIVIPPPPLTGEQTVIRYKGPMFLPIRAWDIFLDPLIEEIESQPWVIQRVLKPRAWVEARTGSDPIQPFEARSVEYAMSSWNGGQLDEYEQSIATSRGLSVSSYNVPERDDYVELLEVWHQTEPQAEAPYCVVLNRKAVINKDKQPPHRHGQCTIGALRNVMVPGHFYGISDIGPSKALYEEANTHRSLRLDSVKLAVLPIFTRLNGQGIPELYNHLRPGMQIPVATHNLFKRMDLGSTPAEAYREMSEIKNDIDETNATGQNVRGGVATVGRVSATETQGRVTQALLRTKMTAALMSEDLQPFLNQMVSLWDQYGVHETVSKVTGGAGVVVTPGTLYQALSIAFKFRGPTRALNRDMQAQQLQAFVNMFAQWLAPEEIRQTMKAYLEAVGMRGVDKIVSEGGTKELAAAWRQKSQLQAQQTGNAQVQANAQQEALTESSGGATTPPEGEAQPQ